MGYLWKNVLLESASMFVGNITASHTIFSGNVTAASGFIGTASFSTSASYSNTSDTASYILSSTTSSYSDFADSSSYVSGTIVVPGIDREILINDGGYVGRSNNFQYTTENALILNPTSSEPPVVEGGMYIDALFSKLRICVTSSTLYYDG